MGWNQQLDYIIDISNPWITFKDIVLDVQTRS